MAQRRAVKRSSRILIHAIQEEDIGSIAKLIKYGANVSGADYEGNTPSHHAVFAENVKILEMLLINGAEVDAVNNTGLRPYDVALELNNIEVIGMLLKHGARLDMDYFDRPARQLPQELLNLFYEYADAKEVSSLGNTALHCAVKNDDLNGVQLLISKGADVNKASAQEGYVPLHLAKSAKCVELLLRNRAEANVKDKYACTPLYTSALRNKFDREDRKKRLEQARIIKTFIENGADGLDVVYAGQIDLDYGRDWDSMCGLRDVLKYMALLEEQPDYPTKMDLRLADQDSELTGFYKSCLREVTKLKEDTAIFGGLSLHQFATRTAKDLSYRLSNRRILHLFNERRSHYEASFPIYFEILKGLFDEAIARRRLLDAASSSLSGILRCIDNSHIVTQRILECLSTRDLRCLISAYPLRPDRLDT